MAADRINVKKLVFIGAGNMAEAIVRGLIAGGVCKTDKIFVTDAQQERLFFFRNEFNIAGYNRNADAVNGADIVILAVKPQVMGEVLDGLHKAIDRKALVISIAAGISTAWIEGKLGQGMRVVRVMPNTPALVRAGAAAICGGRSATDADLAIVETMMGAVGVVVRVQEKDMDAVTALSGSGPAYIFHLMEAMIAAAHHAGLDGAVAKKLVYATIAGAAKLAAESGVDPAELRKRVTSKGGTTEAALEVLEEKSVYHAYLQAIAAAHRRSRELSGG